MLKRDLDTKTSNVAETLEVFCWQRAMRTLFNRCCFVAFLFILSHIPVSTLSANERYFPEEKDSTASSIAGTRLALVIGGTAGIVAAAHLQNHDSWWKGDLGKFHLGEDGTAYLHQDKLGHFYFSYLSSDLIGRSFQWAGVRRERALFYGGGIALAFQTYVEIEDGFHPELGFSLGDETFDLIGACWPIAQANSEIFKNITPKWSVIPSSTYKDGKYRNIIDDYESQYIWMSMNIRGMFGEFGGIFIPSFLNIAVGTGVKNLSGPGGGDREFYVGLDIDYDKLPGEGSFLAALKHALNYFHSPLPTLRITPRVVLYGARF